MPAEVDTMMYVNEVPWHKLGVRLNRSATASEAIGAAGLDWEVQLQPLYTGPERTVRIKDRFAICRTDRLGQPDGGQLAVVGRDYTPVMNRQAFSFLDPVVGESGAIYHTAGSLRGGRRVWMLAKLPGEIRVVGDDVAEKYILLSNSHDGTSAVRIGLTPIRVVCMNTLSLALRGMGGLTIRHEADVVQQVQNAYKVLGIVTNAFDVAGEAMRAMARTPMTELKLEAYFDRVMPMPTPDDPERDRIEQRRSRLIELFDKGIGADLPGVHGTLWCAYNAVTQWVDRESWSTRNKEPLNSIWFGEGERMKRLGFDVAAEMAGATLN